MAKIAFWKKWLSYIMEYELERIPSELGYDLSLCVSDGRFQLNAGNAIYSWEDKYDNFFKAFAKINWEEESVQDVLILGVGLASIPQMLEQDFNQSLQYTGVELDQDVIYLAEKYIISKLKSPITIIEADAAVFVELETQQYDMITIDIFVETSIPEAFLTREFIEKINTLLRPGGLVLFNHLTNSKKEKTFTQRYFKNIFLPIFPNSTALNVRGNHILMNRKLSDIDQ